MVLLFLPDGGDVGDAGWLEALRGRRAVARGRVRRNARRRVLLVPDAAGAAVTGRVVDVDEARLRVLDLVEGMGGAHRTTIRVSVALRVLDAEAYVAESR